MLYPSHGAGVRGRLLAPSNFDGGSSCAARSACVLGAGKRERRGAAMRAARDTESAFPRGLRCSADLHRQSYDLRSRQVRHWVPRAP